MNPNGLTLCNCGNERRMNERLCEACLLARAETVRVPTALPTLRRPFPERRHVKVAVVRSELERLPGDNTGGTRIVRASPADLQSSLTRSHEARRYTDLATVLLLLLVVGALTAGLWAVAAYLPEPAGVAAGGW